MTALFLCGLAGVEVAVVVYGVGVALFDRWGR